MNGTSGPRRSSGGGAADPKIIATLVIHKDETGFGMKVSGDNPVYVVSVKEGGAAERAGLHAGDTILKVNGTNVAQYTHSEVVEMIQSSTQAVLTVQQNPAKTVPNMSPPNNPFTKQQQLLSRSSSTTTMTPVVSQSHTHLHRASTAPAGATPSRVTAPQPVDLEKKRQLETEKVQTYRLMLEKEQSHIDMLRSQLAKIGSSQNSGVSNMSTTNNNNQSAIQLQSDLMGAERRVKIIQDHLIAITNAEQDVADIPPPLPSRKFLSMQSLSPPPLPPRPKIQTDTTYSNTVSRRTINDDENDFQLLQGDMTNKHQRTKSSPEQLGNVGFLSPVEATMKLITSESMNDLVRHTDMDLEEHITPPGTPPPPYLVPGRSTPSNELGDSAGHLGIVQQPIMSMEDDEMSDQDMGQLEDHGYFKSLTQLKDHHAHLAVFINYVMSNCDPSSLFFYLITDQYMNVNAKEKRKWAYEIHSSFLIPGAPLPVPNVDENIANEIDDVLCKEFEKEEKLHNIFQKARARAKEVVNEQLSVFQQTRIAGLGTMFGPSDIQLDECSNDRAEELKIIEARLLPKMEPYLEDIEKENMDSMQFTTAAALATILTKVFQIRPVTTTWSLDRVPTFVAKDKSYKKARLLAGKNTKILLKGHKFVAHQYLTTTSCNHCKTIIGGIGPQGYMCRDCLLRVHRHCVKIVQESCPGPWNRKERGNDRISKLMDKIRPEKKHNFIGVHTHSLHGHGERVGKWEDDGTTLTDEENNTGGGNSRVVGWDKGQFDTGDNPSSREDISQMVTQSVLSKPKMSNINRSESYKERIHHKRQLREKRKTSDPNLSKTNDCDPATGSFPGNSAGSSSNSSLSTRSLDSPSTSLEHVHPVTSSANSSATWDSDVDVEPDPPDWSQGVTEDVLTRLSTAEKKRQEVINELFHTERSHVRSLKVLSYSFHRPIKDSQVLPQEQIDLLFSNLDEMLTIHSRFNQSMKKKKKENPCVGSIGDLLLEMFDGDSGESFERAASKYCAKQQIALDSLRERRKKDSKLNQFLNEIEANPLCRRLQLKDLILTGMLRLTKYPLLFENLVKYTQEGNERTAVIRCVERSKEILSRVNQAVKEAEDYQKLVMIQRLIEKSILTPEDINKEYRKMDLTTRKLIHEGPLQWRRTEQNRSKPVDLYVVLLDDLILILHRQDDKYLLKTITNGSNSPLSPIVQVSTVLVRPNATDKNSLYLVNMSAAAKIYDLVAPNQNEAKIWCDRISELTEEYSKKHPTKAGRRSSDGNRRAHEEEGKDGEHDRAREEKDDGVERIQGLEEEEEEEEEQAPQEEQQEQKEEREEEQEEEQREEVDGKENADGEASSNHVESSGKVLGYVAVGEPLRMVTCVPLQLIEPDNLQKEMLPVHLAEPVLTPFERLKRQDESINDALMEKQYLIADILNIPREDFDYVVDIATDPSNEKREPTELVLAAIVQANKLTQVLHSSLLRLTEHTIVESAFNPTSTKQPYCNIVGCPNQQLLGSQSSQQSTSSVQVLQPISHTLNTQLSQLLEIVKQREEERDRLKKELAKTRERLHAIDVEIQRKQFTHTITIATQTDDNDRIINDDQAPDVAAAPEIHGEEVD